MMLGMFRVRSVMYAAAAAALVVGTGPGAAAASASSASAHPSPAGVSSSVAPSVPGSFVSLSPARILDTRYGTGAARAKVAKHAVVHLQVTGAGGVPVSGVSAVVLNVTVTNPTSSGYITAYPDGASRPTASNLNLVKGQTVPNLVVVKLGTGGRVSLYNGTGGTVDLIADVAGYYLAGTATEAGAFTALSPARILDTRYGTGAARAKVAKHAVVHLQVTGAGGVPASGVSAVVLNVTATNPASSGYITAYPDGASRPTASNLNLVKGQTVPNLVVVKLGTGGRVSLYNGTGGTVDLIADVAGYYLAGTATAAGAFTALSPARILDTRYGTGAARAKVAKHAVVHLQVTGKGGVPVSGVSAVVLNVTATNPSSSGYITAYPDGSSRPTASNLNLVTGQTVPNLVVVKLGTGGKVSLYNGTGGTVDLIADVAGYYLADTTGGKQWVSLSAPSVGYTPGVNRFAATLVPAITGRTVLLQRDSQGLWVNVGSGVEDAHGVVEWNPTLSGSGDSDFRAYSPATVSLEAAASATSSVSLRPIPPPAPNVSIQIAPSVSVGSATQLDLQGALNLVTTAVVPPGAMPLGVTLGVVNGSLLLQASADAATGSFVLPVSGKGCEGDACSTPYDLEIDLTIAPLSNVSAGIAQFADPSTDRIASAGQLPGGTATALPDELLVVLGSDTQPGTVYDAQAIADQSGAVVTGGIETIGVYQLRWTTAVDLTQMTSTLTAIGGVAAVEPAALLGDLNLTVSPPGDWDDDGTAVTWPFTQMRLQQAWSTTTGGSAAVGVLESDAVFKDHEDLNVTTVLGPGTVNAAEPHATHVAGLACATANGKGVVGAAWGCPIVSGTFAVAANSTKAQVAADVLQGATDLAASGVGVINMSIGDNYSQEVATNHYEHCIDKASSDALQKTEQSLSAGFRRLFNSRAGRDIVWTISAGNNCASGVTSAWGVSWALPNVITVAATNSDKSLASFSNFGPGVEVAAPGGVGIGLSGGSDGLWSTTATTCGWLGRSLCSAYGTMSGTSMAAPLVAGVAELAETANPTATAAEIGSCIVATAGTLTGNVTQRSAIPSSVTSGSTTTTFTPSISFGGAANPIPIVDAEAAVKCAQTGQAKADVLVAGMGDRTSSGNGTDRGDLVAALTAHGFTVQVSDALPPDLSKYGQIWYLDTDALSADDTMRVETYVQNGGSAYLTGERPCCTDSDTVIAVINALTADTVAYGGELAATDFVISRNPYDIASNPNTITYLAPDAPGSLTGVSDPHIVADDGAGLTVWAAYGPNDVMGGGKLVAVMDINYIAEQYRSANWGEIVDNIASFLGKPSGALAAAQYPGTKAAPRNNNQRITSGGGPGSTTG